MIADAKFLFTVCQVGAESAMKAELARSWPEFRFAFSRPGFVTFKLPATLRLATDFDLGSTFARTYGFSLGNVAGTSSAALIRRTWELAEHVNPDHVHVWQRDRNMPGDNEFEPGPTLLAEEIGRQLVEAHSKHPDIQSPLRLNEIAERNQRILDCVIVEPDEWWIGFHEATSIARRWPGGVPQIQPPDEMFSRAYFKVIEGLLWSALPIKRNDPCVEIGSAPGGSSAALLERGLQVMGIDPAEMDPQILAHPNFTHVRKRASDVKRREFRHAKWLFADANISPQETLSDVRHIVTHREVDVRGMLLTLKFSEWSIAEQIPDFVEQVTSWGYQDVRCRQLAYNRQEICLAARRTRVVRS